MGVRCVRRVRSGAGLGFTTDARVFFFFPVWQFFITTVETHFLDGKHVVFGRVVNDGQSMLSVRKIEAVPTGVNDRPRLPVRIVGECPIREWSGPAFVADPWVSVQSVERCRVC